ncbi:ATP-binding protein [Kitasatospora sp. NPDC087315]|uniref:ATP-binding protein n=1 Tax=Kitasatospora sp. NPDC087315 TaxID=3364069 RepID=UPI0037FC619F
MTFRPQSPQEISMLGTVVGERHVALGSTRTSSPCAAARAAVRDTVSGWVSPPVLDDAVLAVSELVGNAEVHGGGAVAMVIVWADQGVAVTVVDAGCGASAIEKSAAALGGVEDRVDDEGGRGLLIVDGLSTAWWIRQTESGTAVSAAFQSDGVKTA